MNKRRRVIISLFAGGLVILGCGIGSSTLRGEKDATAQILKVTAVEESKGGKCASIMPPKTFQEADLVGTWGPEYGTNGHSILIVKENGTYKQIYNNPITGQHFESDWHKWWVEYRQSGIPNLHLEKMRLCDNVVEDFCQLENGGGGSYPIWIDFCEGRVIEMHDEVVLLVLGIEPDYIDRPPRGILLHVLRPDPDTGVNVFELQK
jgi:hypothetical protein